MERELVDDGEVGRLRHRDGEDLRAARAHHLEREDAELLRHLLGDELEHARLDGDALELHDRDVEVDAERVEDLLFAAEPLLHQDVAELAAPFLLVPERAVELVLINEPQFDEQGS